MIIAQFIIGSLVLLVIRFSIMIVPSKICIRRCSKTGFAWLHTTTDMQLTDYYSVAIHKELHDIKTNLTKCNTD